MDEGPLVKLIDSTPALVATRYFTLTGFVVLLWDHLLTFEDEIEYIWKWPVQPSKVVFLFNRYFVEAALCLSVYAAISFSWLKRTSATVTFHIQSVWEKRRSVTYALLVGFCITYGVTVVCAGLVINDLQSHILWIPEINSCIVPHKPLPFIGVWAGMVTFDIFVLVMLFTNAVDRPYRQNSDVVDTLRRDGVKFLAVVRVESTFVKTGAPVREAGEILVIVFFIWAVVSITLSRFLLMVKATEAAKNAPRAAIPMTTTLWRSSSGYWSRQSDFIEPPFTQ
ncbi:hypothetical protein BJ322DRAFT_1158656 [Thelephora terrestris]|uniref:DUF6533 domain-containing protein n=1 Tax=Thelephora terrestris TaxID=56493 RepID=A0A9P6L4J2_9AGAM|nr:hypothetical protein BJ322DRAFT_1158656 [Thelephora terrestris]